MKTCFLFFILSFIAVSATAQTMPAGGDPVLWEKALRIHRKAVIIDGHNDITGPMTDEDFDLSTDSRNRKTRTGDAMHTDISRLKAGGMTASSCPFMSAAKRSKQAVRCGGRWT
jgi:hypothetical protein